MAKVLLPVGMENFSEIRRNGCFYADKTAFISELLSEAFKVNLITRPRRFGKTSAMRMLADFLDIQKDSRDIFAGLQIAENEKCCEEWMNQWPVIFLTLKSVEGLDFDSAYERLAALISRLYIQHYDLLENHSINENDKELLRRIAAKKASREEIKNSLFTLTGMMQTHYGKQVILLVDEYDVPIAAASEHGYYDQMLEVLRSMLNTSLKTNDALKFAVITGCLRIAKESIFTGTNHFVSNSIVGERYSRYFGFTEKEVRDLLRKAGFADHAGEMKKWYDGYRFGNTEVYCPWDVLNYVNDLQVNSKALPGNYWKNTSHNGIIRSFVDRTDLQVNEKFETLLSGGCIQENIVDDLTYDVLHSSEANLWSVLYLTGYLTKAEKEVGLTDEPGIVWLRIPNEEVKNIFAETISGWFTENISRTDRTELFHAFWNGNTGKVTALINDILFDTISYYDYKEDYYHAFLAGIFAGAGYAVESNREYGLGRPDIVVRDRKNRRVIILEVKRSLKRNNMEKDAESAISQIDVKQYAQQFLKGYQTVLCYGAAFFEKECEIKQVGGCTNEF